jgi:hypothetical protein
MTVLRCNCNCNDRSALPPAQRPGKLWLYTRPYRGLEAMTEANSDYSSL